MLTLKTVTTTTLTGAALFSWCALARRQLVKNQHFGNIYKEPQRRKTANVRAGLYKLVTKKSVTVHPKTVTHTEPVQNIRVGT